jgi:thioredoxin-like negative regulator of GroEL
MNVKHFSAFIFLTVYVSGLKIERRNLIQLYDVSDKVVEFTDANLTSTVFNSQQIWVVEFYAHWCGHCQKFVKIWKKIAEEFYGKI